MITAISLPCFSVVIWLFEGFTIWRNTFALLSIPPSLYQYFCSLSLYNTLLVVVLSPRLATIKGRRLLNPFTSHSVLLISMRSSRSGRRNLGSLRHLSDDP